MEETLEYKLYKLSVIQKYLTDSYGHRDTPAFIRYNHTKTKEDLQKLLDEYLEDSTFLGVNILDDILDKIEHLLDTLQDKGSLAQCQFFYDIIYDLREAKCEKLQASDWQLEVLTPLLNSLGIDTE